MKLSEVSYLNRKRLGQWVNRLRPVGISSVTGDYNCSPTIGVRAGWTENISFSIVVDGLDFNDGVIKPFIAENGLGKKQLIRPAASRDFFNLKVFFQIGIEKDNLGTRRSHGRSQCRRGLGAADSEREQQ